MNDIRKGVCPLCQNNEILEAVPGVSTQDGATAPLVASRLTQDSPAGVLRVFVCRKCGYSQWFAEEPRSIPVGAREGTRLIKGPS